MQKLENLLLVPVWFKNATYVMAAFIGIEHNALLAFISLMVCDVIVGVIASAKCCGWKSVTSHRLAFGLLSKILMVGIPFFVALAGTANGYDLKYLINSSIMILSFSELYSVIGNIYSIKTGKRVPEFDAVSVVLQNVRAVLEGIVKKSQ